jgi:hypothetical protein
MKVPPPRITVIVEINWVPFHPKDWRAQGSCYPCMVWDTANDIIYTMCDPWTLPADSDYSDLLCAPTSALRPDRAPAQVPQHRETNQEKT